MLKFETPDGAPALSLLTNGAVPDKLAEAAPGQKFEIISTNLSKNKQARCARL